jgi:hypothetical protein
MNNRVTIINYSYPTLAEQGLEIAQRDWLDRHDEPAVLDWFKNDRLCHSSS